MDQLVSLE
ncbi:hypothetical protein F383_36593 [Gossypium arboreum]|uniref:Uncharacterized protein n=1 Tax=Gossypium arboreum TaxID=29729 RepID=A0A0B0MEV0_GOSAR|nr:hypothetical protein F383_36593 [Gossypium arboreum]